MNVITPAADPDLLDFLQRSTGLDERTARHVVLEVLSYYGETLADFVQRRHRELQAPGGLRNADIYRLIADEAAARPFGIEAPSVRQVRRMIYG